MTEFWADRRVVVTGGAGFLGSRIVRRLRDVGTKEIIVPRKHSDDLRQWQHCQRTVQGADMVIHAAGNVGGIGLNRERPGELFYDNLIMGAQLMEAARQAGVKKFVTIGTVCSYPSETPVPFKEDYLWEGYPEPTNAPYGIAKKALLVQAQSYRQQYDFDSIYLLPVNLYGPEDNFDPRSSHVIPALIKKVLEAKDAGEDCISLWGTGIATREFLYVDDAARAIVLAAERYESGEPINIGTSEEISVRDLAILIMRLGNYRGEIRWDPTKPDGQLRRKLDTTRAEREIGFIASVPLSEGLKNAIDWYQMQRGGVVAVR
jgi:GDP-L-fucose synthase